MRRNRWFALVSLCLLFIFVVGVIPVSAADSEDDSEIILTMDEAVSRAIRYSDSLEKTELSTEMEDYRLTDAQLDFKAEWITDYVPGTEQYYVALLNARYNYDAALKNEEIQKDSIAVDTRNEYYNVLQAIRNVEEKEKELELAEREQYIGQAKYGVGLINWSSWQQAQVSFSNAEAALLDAQNDLETAYRSFDRQVGLDIQERPVLSDLPAYEEIQMDNVDSTIKSIVKESPETWMNEESLELQERLSNYPGSSEQDELSLEQAEINADIQEINTVDALYGVYYSIIALEQNYNISQLNLEIAEENLKHAELKYSVGLVSEIDVINAELALIKQKNSIFSMQCQHELLKIAFEQPWS